MLSCGTTLISKTFHHRGTKDTERKENLLRVLSGRSWSVHRSHRRRYDDFTAVVLIHLPASLRVFVSLCLYVRFDKSTSTATASKLVPVSGVPAREDAAPSNLDYQSKRGNSDKSYPQAEPANYRLIFITGTYRYSRRHRLCVKTSPFMRKNNQ